MDDVNCYVDDVLLPQKSSKCRRCYGLLPSFEVESFDKRYVTMFNIPIWGL